MKKHRQKTPVGRKTSTQSLTACRQQRCLCVMHQLFDVDNHVNRHAVNYIFSTEGHLFPVSALLRRAASHQHTDVSHSQQADVDTTLLSDTKDVFTMTRLYNLTSNVSPLLITLNVVVAVYRLARRNQFKCHSVISDICSFYFAIVMGQINVMSVYQGFQVTVVKKIDNIKFYALLFDEGWYT